LEYCDGHLTVRFGNWRNAQHIGALPLEIDPGQFGIQLPYIENDIFTSSIYGKQRLHQ
jgi:hypothetical protein